MAYYSPKMVGERLYHFGYGRTNRDKYIKWRDIARKLGYFVACKPDHAARHWLCFSDRSRKLWEAMERKAKGGAE